MIPFPTTTEAFIAYQEASTGRKLEGLELDLTAVVVELINISYQEGAEGRTHTVSMDGVEAFFQERDLLFGGSRSTRLNRLDMG